MAKISAGNGYIIETLEGGYKMLHCPDGKQSNGIAAYSDISLGQFKKICKEWIEKRITATIK